MSAVQPAHPSAELAGNNALRAWVRGTQALVASWDDRPRAAVELATDGWRFVPETGTGRIRLAAIEARARARLRDQRATEDALTRAEQAREEVRGDDDPGGMLAFPVAKQTCYAATARLWLGGRASYTDAERDAERSVQLYETDPPEQRRLDELCLARLDLAVAQLGRDDLDGTAEQVENVFTVAAWHTQPHRQRHPPPPPRRRRTGTPPLPNLRAYPRPARPDPQLYPSLSAPHAARSRRVSASVTVGLLHPGLMGAAISAQIASNGHTVLWCPDGRSEASHHRAKDAGLHPAPLGELLAASELILSICAPAVAEEIATTVAEAGYHGIYVDANAISPARMHRITTRLTEAGAVVIDGCIFGPPPGGQPPARLYLAGTETASRRVADLFTGTLAQPVLLGEQSGQASALKMAFASYQKASRTLAALAHALADDHDVTEALLREAHRMPSDLLADRDYLPSVAARAWRWAPEMREVADTLTARHLPSDLALATAEVLQHWDDTMTDPATDPVTALQHLHDRQELPHGAIQQF